MKTGILIGIALIMCIFGSFEFGKYHEGKLSIEYPKGSCNIAFGEHAGYWWTDENFQFAITMPYDEYTYAEYSTTLSPVEYEVVICVVRRAAKNVEYRNIPEKGK